MVADISDPTLLIQTFSFIFFFSCFINHNRTYDHNSNYYNPTHFVSLFEGSLFVGGVGGGGHGGFGGLLNQ